MFEAHKNNVKLYVLPTKSSVASNLAVIIEWDSHANWIALRKLQREKKTSDMQFQGSECTAMCFAIYKTIVEKMIGSVREMKQTQTSHFTCDTSDCKFRVAYNVKSSMGTLAKSLAKIYSVLDPDKATANYKLALSNLNLSYDKATHEMTSACLRSSISSELRIFVCGKVNLKTKKQPSELENVKKICDLVALDVKKIEKSSCKTGDYKLSIETTELKASGAMGTFVAIDYLETKLKMRAEYHDKKIYLWGSTGRIESFKSTVGKWVKQKYESMGDNMKGITCYYNMLNVICTPCVDTLVSFAKLGTTDNLIKEAENIF
jgi:hypothetical protein